MTLSSTVIILLIEFICHALCYSLKDPTKAQETKDAICISTWKSSLKGYNRTTCSKELCSYLDDNMPGWRLDHHKSKPRSKQGKEKALRALIAGTTTGELDKFERSTEVLMPQAIGIVERFHANNDEYPSLKLKCRQDPSRAQEYSDAKKLHDWKSHVDKSHASEVFEYLDQHMPFWKSSHVKSSNAMNKKNTPLSKAREIVKRCGMRSGSLPQVVPFGDQRNPELILEHKDAVKLREWKISFLEKPHEFCSVLKSYLYDKLPNWITVDVTTPLPPKMKVPLFVNHKRKFSTHSSNASTDDEMVSTDGSSGNVSDDESGERRCSHSKLPFVSLGVEAKRMKLAIPTHPNNIDSDENASIVALLQLSADTTFDMPAASVTTTSTTNCAPVLVPVADFAATAPLSAPIASYAVDSCTPSPLMLEPQIQAFSTYGNKCTYGNTSRVTQTQASTAQKHTQVVPQGSFDTSYASLPLSERSSYGLDYSCCHQPGEGER
jgi:hypothetical protein